MWREAWVSEMTNNAAIIKTGNDLEFYFFKKSFLCIMHAIYGNKMEIIKNL